MNSTISSEPGVTAQSAQSAQAMAESPSTRSSSARKLPYQASHQVELMHLEAETEALLQQLQAMKKRRQMMQTAQPEPVLAVC